MDFNQGFLATPKPSKPLKSETPRKIAAFPGTDYNKYLSFLQTVNDLSMIFKFNAPTGITNRVLTSSYRNVDLDPLANDWELIEGQDDLITTDDDSVLEAINSHFASQWGDIQAAGGGESYDQLAKSDISSYSPEQAFNLMCSMLESKERVFLAFENMFGEAETANTVGNDQMVIDNITAFLDSYMTEEGKFGLDPHNVCVLSIFFNLQTSFINGVDAYVNNNTYWGGDGSQNILMSKVESYIAGLSGDADKQEAAGELRSMWLTHMDRWDNVSGTHVSDLTKTEGSWVKFWSDKMNNFNNERAVRTLVAHMMDRSADSKYKTKMQTYETAKDEKTNEEIALAKMAAKRKSSNSRGARRSSPRSSQMSKALKARGSRASLAARAGGSRPKPSPARVSMANKHASAATKVSRVRPQASQPRVPSATSTAAKPQSGSNKSRKVI